jgi:bile acid:Na+ symporter, BASS family
MNMVAMILLAIKISIAMSVFALGLRATVADATYLFRRPALLFRALLSMNLLMPLIAFALGVSSDLSPAVKIALVALSVSPVPPMFPKKALKDGCTEAYAIGLLVAASVLSIITIPLTISIIGKVVLMPLQMSGTDIAVLVFKTVLAPLLAGILVCALAPSLAGAAAKPIAISASVLLIAAALPVLFGSGRVLLSLIGNGTILSLAAFALVGLVVGHLLGGPEAENRHVLSLATASRHPGIAVAIAQANFPQQKLALPAILLYLIVAAIVSAIASFRRTRPEKLPKAQQKAA